MNKTNKIIKNNEIRLTVEWDRNEVNKYINKLSKNKEKDYKKMKLYLKISHYN